MNSLIIFIFIKSNNVSSHSNLLNAQFWLYLSLVLMTKMWSMQDLYVKKNHFDLRTIESSWYIYHEITIKIQESNNLNILYFHISDIPWIILNIYLSDSHYYTIIISQMYVKKLKLFSEKFTRKYIQILKIWIGKLHAFLNEDNS